MKNENKDDITLKIISMIDKIRPYLIGDGGNIEARLLRYILEHHRFELGLIPRCEIFVLILEYRIHCAGEGVLPLLERFHEPLGGIQFLPHESRCLLLFPLG